MTTTHYSKLFMVMSCALLLATGVHSQEPVRQAQRFSSDGLAPVTVADKSFYIDRNGHRVFDTYENPDQPWKLPAGTNDDTVAFVVIKDGLKGLRGQGGTWVLAEPTRLRSLPVYRNGRPADAPNKKV